MTQRHQAADRAFVEHKSQAVVSHTLLNMRRCHTLRYSLHHEDRPLAGRTAIVVGAGPSLARNGAYLRDAQSKGVTILAVNAADAPLRRLGVVPDVLVARESLDLVDQIEATEARMVILDVSVAPATWTALVNKPCEGRWYLPLYTRHYLMARKLGLRALGTGSAALTAAVAHAIQWGAQRVVLVGVDLASHPDGQVYHPDAPRGQERATQGVVRTAEGDLPTLTFAHREQDRDRVERSGQVFGPDTLKADVVVAADCSRPLVALDTWTNQRQWLEIQGQRHRPWVDCVNATEGGGGVVWWRNAKLSDVVDNEPRREPWVPPRGTEITEDMRDVVLDDLRHEAARLETAAREQLSESGPDALQFVRMPRLVSGAPLVGCLAAKALLGGPEPGYARLRYTWQAFLDAATRGEELLT